MAGAHDVAACVLAHVGPMSAMKLQKLVYYCQCWHLAREDSELFPEPIEAWREGPVVKALYSRHRGAFRLASWPDGDPSRLSASQLDTVRWVCERYGAFSAEELSSMTHGEAPWIVARGTLPPGAPGNTELSVEIMKNFYARQVAAPEAAVLHATANAALEGVDLDPEWVERLRDVATGTATADDIIAEEVAR